MLDRLNLLRFVRKTVQFLVVHDLPTLRELRNALFLAVAVEAPFLVVISLVRAQPWGHLATVDDPMTLFAAMLGGQGAIAALTLAVTLFVMQGVSSRRDADDRIYAEYIRRSRVRKIFWGSIVAVAVTGSVLTIQAIFGGMENKSQAPPGLANLTLIATAAFVANLLAALLLFEQAIRLARPENWRKLRLDVNRRDVREAVRGFISRRRRASEAQAEGRIDPGIYLADLGEGSADQAVRSLLDDALRAMDERRYAEFGQSLDAIIELVEHAMDEMEKAAVEWRPPGAQPQWPPLSELGRSMYSFREEVIRRDNADYIMGLHKMDYRFVATGLQRSCGDLFTAGLEGYLMNYQISASRGGGVYHELIRDRFTQHLEGIAYSREPEDLLPYLEEIIKHQERFLNEAMRYGRPADFLQIHDGFHARLHRNLWHWQSIGELLPDRVRLLSRVAQDYRITLMVLAGQAVILAREGKISDVTPYVQVANRMYTSTRALGDDLAAALSYERDFDLTRRLRMEGHRDLPLVLTGGSQEEYPLTFFALRLMTMVGTATVTLNLLGNAKRVLSWFEANSGRLQPFIRETAEMSADQRRQFAIEVLEKAVETDDIEEDEEMSNRPVSVCRKDAFATGVRAGKNASHSVGRLFREAGRLTCLDADAGNLPEERGLCVLEPKGFFVDPAERDRTYYSPIDGDEWGRELSRSTIDLLCANLEDANPMTAQLDNPDALFLAIDLAIMSLAPVGPVAILLAGDCEEVLFDPRAERADGFVPAWRLTGTDPVTEIGQYRSHPMLRGPLSGERRVYVIDVSTWGNYVLASIADGQDLRVEIESITPDRAEQLLIMNPNYFPDQPDKTSKLRKLRSRAEVRVHVRDGFQIDDPARARRITPEQPEAARDPENGEYASECDEQILPSDPTDDAVC